MLDEAALTESTYGDSRSLKMRQQLQADMADLARTAPDVSLFTEGGSFFGTYGDSRSLKMRQQLQAGMAALVRTTPNVSLLLLLTLFSHIISRNPCIYLSYRVL